MNSIKLIMFFTFSLIFCCDAQQIGRVKSASTDSELSYTNILGKPDQKLVKILDGYDYLNSGHTLLYFNMARTATFLAKHKDDYAGEVYLLLTMLEPVTDSNNKCALFFVERVKFEGDKIMPYGYYARVFRDEKLWSKLRKYLKAIGADPFEAPHKAVPHHLRLPDRFKRGVSP